MNERSQVTRDKARAKAAVRARSYRDFLDTPNGKLILEDLTQEFDPPVLANLSIESTAMRAAQRDVVRYIIEMARGEEK